jgi:hypothetical protein
MSTSQIIQLNTYTVKINSIVQSLTGENARIDNAQTRNEKIVRRAYLKAMAGLLTLVSRNLRATKELVRRYGQATTLVHMGNVHPSSAEARGRRECIDIALLELGMMVGSFGGIARVGL